MSNYIDGFILPVPRTHVKEYQQVASQVAEIWKEHGALDYFEYIGEDLKLGGTRAFPEALGAGSEEVSIFGWVVFESKNSRDRINKLVISDPRMEDLVGSLTDPNRLIFDARRMVYGGFERLV